MSWTLAPALVQLRQELNARWPGRSKASDGTIGDAAHKARVSEHNPDADGVVAGTFEIAPPDKPEAFKTYLSWTMRRAPAKK